MCYSTKARPLSKVFCSESLNKTHKQTHTHTHTFDAAQTKLFRLKSLNFQILSIISFALPDSNTIGRCRCILKFVFHIYRPSCFTHKMYFKMSTNIFHNFDKYISKFQQIYFKIWTQMFSLTSAIFSCGCFGGLWQSGWLRMLPSPLACLLACRPPCFHPRSGDSLAQWCASTIPFFVFMIFDFIPDQKR